MDKKIMGILLQIVKRLDKENGWMVDKDWELTYKSNGHISLVKTVEVEGQLDQAKWKEQVPTQVDLKMTSEDEWTYWPEFTIFAQVKIAAIDSEDIAYKMTSNVAYMADDVKDETKAGKAAREINQSVNGHIQKVYQQYVDKNKEAVRYYMQSIDPSTPDNGTNPVGA